MEVWLSYSLSDFLLFSPRTYFRLFELHNAAVWPLHVLAAVLGLLILWMMRPGEAWRGRVLGAVLAACWLWVAWAFLYERYDPINWMARYAALGFAVQAALLLLYGAVLGRLTPGRGWAARIGFAVAVFALVLQPLVAPLAGRPWLQAEVFGLAPDPTVALTLGVLLAIGRVPWLLLVVPVVWCAATGLTLSAMGAPESLLMPAIGAIALVVALTKSIRR